MTRYATASASRGSVARVAESKMWRERGDPPLGDAKVAPCAKQRAQLPAAASPSRPLSTGMRRGMKDIVYKEVPRTAITLPPGVAGGFAETQAALAMRSAIIWGGHCSECGFPS